MPSKLNSGRGPDWLLWSHVFLEGHRRPLPETVLIVRWPSQATEVKKKTCTLPLSSTAALRGHCGVGEPVKEISVTEEAEPQKTPSHLLTGAALEHEQKTVTHASHRANTSTDEQ